jgi:hypothetical protein
LISLTSGDVTPRRSWLRPHAETHLPRHDAQHRRSGGRKTSQRCTIISTTRKEILFKVMEVLVANYRTTLAMQFAAPQKLHERIADLLRFNQQERKRC